MCPEVRVEDARPVFLRDAGAVVCDLDHRAPAPVVSMDAHTGAAVAQGVGHEVANYLAEPPRVRPGFNRTDVQVQALDVS